MKEKPQKRNIQESHQSVCGSVLERIEHDHIQPRSRIFFHSRECAVWLMWLITVLVGAVAVAVTLYVSLNLPYMLYEATHENFLTAAVSMLPYIWLVVFLVMAYFAIYNLRHTKRGYRYRTVELLASSVLASLCIGVGLQVAGQGYVLDKTLGVLVTAYPSYEKTRLALWQEPKEGRMIGTLLPVEDAGADDEAQEQFVFHDMEETVWQIDVSELRERDLELLHSSGPQRVRVVGTTTAANVFHLCGVFPWSSDERMTRAELQAERQAFLLSLQTHMSAVTTTPAFEAPGMTTSLTGSQQAVPEMEDKPCQEIAAVQRLRHGNQ